MKNPELAKYLEEQIKEMKTKTTTGFDWWGGHITAFQHVLMFLENTHEVNETKEVSK